MRHTFLIVAVLISQYAWSENPAPGAAKAGKPQQAQSAKGENKGASDKQLAEKTPLIINNIFSPNEAKTPSNNDSKNCCEESSWKGIWEAIAAIATAILAVITWFLVVYTKQLWASTAKIANDTKESSERQLRAYVHVSHSMISASETKEAPPATLQIIREGAYVFSEIKFKNAGKTPAHDCVSHIGIHLADWPLKEVLPKLSFDESDRLSKLSLGPGMKRLSRACSGLPLDAEKLGFLKSGGKAIFIYGAIRYRDAFNGTHTTHFRYYTGGPVGINSNNLAAHPEGNEAD